MSVLFLVKSWNYFHSYEQNSKDPEITWYIADIPFLVDTYNVYDKAI